ncbi:MAG: hypothetical protein E7321_03405 [Clostridiales bacterium]|nr:hypothetical protein [Clostridiales bacterium]
MIEASFKKNAERGAAASGAYQYDTGQRMRMHGLPSPEELAEGDDFLSGSMVTMQVHYALKGDSQTQTRLALWDEGESCWTAAIPDEYLQTAENVYAYVYVSYGLDEEGNGRTKTMYELVFRPLSRPAPNNVATSEQWEAWAVKREETELVMNAALAAQENAENAEQHALASALAASQAAQDTQAATENAREAMLRMEDVQTRWNHMGVRTIPLAAGSEALAQISGSVLTLGLPCGADGAKGETGSTGPADLAFSMAEGILTITPKE